MKRYTAVVEHKLRHWPVGLLCAVCPAQAKSLDAINTNLRNGAAMLLDN
jgi:hypothetical protein